jgi:hypothetical protein
MGEKRDAKLFLLMGLLSSIVILGLISIIFQFSGLLFAAELIAVLFLGFVALISLAAIYNGLNFGFGFLAFMFSLTLLNLLYVYFKIKPIDSTYLMTIVSASLGFVTSIINIGARDEVIRYIEPAPEPRSEPEATPEPEPQVEPEPEPVQEQKIEKETTVKKTYSPGKVVASKTGSYYHSPKCEWAKKIKKKSWYYTKAEAEEDGLKPHNCLK